MVPTTKYPGLGRTLGVGRKETKTKGKPGGISLERPGQPWPISSYDIFSLLLYSSIVSSTE